MEYQEAVAAYLEKGLAGFAHLNLSDAEMIEFLGRSVVGFPAIIPVLRLEWNLERVLEAERAYGLPEDEVQEIARMYELLDPTEYDRSSVGDMAVELGKRWTAYVNN